MRAKAAITYPPHGIPVLLTGRSQAAITNFIDYLFKTIRSEGGKPSDSRMITVDCLGYELAPDSFLRKLFGCSRSASPLGKSVSGILEAANGGIVHLQNIHRLTGQAMELIMSAIDKGTYYRIGDSNFRQLTATIIASVPSTCEKEIMQRLQNHIPLTLNIPDINQRGAYEKTQLVLQAFSTQALTTNRTLKVDKDVVLYLASKYYDRGDEQLLNEVKLICSNAFIDAMVDSNSVSVGFRHFLQNTFDSDPVDLMLKEKISKVLSLIPSKYLVFMHDGSSTAMQFLKNPPQIYESIFSFPNLELFQPDFDSIKDDARYARRMISSLKKVDPELLSSFWAAIPSYFLQSVLDTLRKYESLKKLLNDRTLLIGMLLPMIWLTLSPKSGQNKHSSLSRHSGIKEITKEYSICFEIANIFEQVYGFALNQRQILFFSHYLQEAIRTAERDIVSILILCHGESTATDMANYIKKSFEGKIAVEGVNFSHDMNIEEFLIQAVKAASEISSSAGILIAADMPPLVSASSYISKRIGVPCRTLTPFSLPLLLSIAEKYVNGIPLTETFPNAVTTFETTGLSLKSWRYDEFIVKLVDNVITPGLSFLDPYKAVDILLIVLHNILDELHLEYSDEIAVKFLTHGVHMLERAIRGGTLNFPLLKRFINDNSHYMEVVERHLALASNTFGVAIPAHEIAYIAEIFRDFKLAHIR